jgi:RNA exonuclease 4
MIVKKYFTVSKMGKPVTKQKPNKHFQKRPNSLTISSFFKPTQTSSIPPSQIVALDCEMIESIENKDILARVSIVSYSGQVLLDAFIKPELEIRDYRTDVTGVDAGLLSKAGQPLAAVLTTVENLLKTKIVVGHGLNNDFDVLDMVHAVNLRRDTAGYRGLRPQGREDKVPALRTLVALHLDGRVIQKGVHSSVEDARCALALYKKVATIWEGEIAKGAKSGKLDEGKKKREIRKARRDGVKRKAKRVDKEVEKKVSLEEAIGFGAVVAGVPQSTSATAKAPAAAIATKAKAAALAATKSKVTA